MVFTVLYYSLLAPVAYNLVAKEQIIFLSSNRITKNIYLCDRDHENK